MGDMTHRQKTWLKRLAAGLSLFLILLAGVRLISVSRLRREATETVPATSHPQVLPRHRPAPLPRIAPAEAERRLQAFHAPIPRFLPDIPPEHQILLVSRRIRTDQETGDHLGQTHENRLTPRGTLPAIMQFETEPDADLRTAVAASGIRITGYLPSRALLVEGAPQTLREWAGRPSLRFLTELAPEDKFAPALLHLARTASARVTVSIVTLQAEDLAPLAEAITRASGRLLSQKSRLIAELDSDSLQDVAKNGTVRWIEPYQPPKLMTDIAHSPSRMATDSLWETWELTGAGQIVSQSDTGVDTGNPATLHPDLRDAVLQVIPLDDQGDGSDTNGHGTHTAGCLAGNGFSSGGRFRGTAYGVSLIVQAFRTDSLGNLFGIPDDLADLFAPTYTLGCRIHSASWGDPYSNGIYATATRQIDRFVWSHPDFLPVFAAGNEGEDVDGDGVVDPDSLTKESIAKNLLCVGASENDRPSGSGGYSSRKWSIFGFRKKPINGDLISTPYDGVHTGLAAFSSRGPCADGRIKPELVAPGTDIVSTRSTLGDNNWGDYPGLNNRYCFMGGTSMATPLVAGAAALMRQYAVERAGIPQPTAALLKAMLVGGTHSLAPGQYGTDAQREIPAQSPNSAEGWGELNIADAVHPNNQMIRLIDDIRIPNHQTGTWTFTLQSAEPFTAVLCWIDYPSVENAATHLVNNYDLVCIAPDGTHLYPNGGHEPDTANTTEAIRIAAPQPGVYTLNVTATRCPFTPEEGGAVALYVRGGFDAEPVIVHTPATSHPSVTDPIPVTFTVQSRLPLTNNTAYVYLRYALGDATAATGEWHTTAPAALSEDRTYTAEIPPRGEPGYWHYEIVAVQPDTGETRSGPYTTYINAPLQLDILGEPDTYGDPTPAYGIHTVTALMPLTLTAPEHVSVSDTLRARCLGFTGTGSAPASGATNCFTFIPSEPSTVTWHWGEQVTFTEQRVTTYSSGFERTNDLQRTWHDTGSIVTTQTAEELIRVSGFDYGFAGWLIDGNRHTENPVTGISLDTARAVQAHYLPYTLDSDNDGIADWWTLRHFNRRTDIDAQDDLDGDGWTNLEESKDNSDPADPVSVPTPPVITCELEDATILTDYPPWTVTATVTDNFRIESVTLRWRETGDAEWQTATMTLLSNDVYTVEIQPPSFGRKTVEYRIFAYDALGAARPEDFYGASDPATLTADYTRPVPSLTPDRPISMNVPLASETPLAFSLENRAGPDLIWNAKILTVTETFPVDDVRWRIEGGGWTRTTHRSEDGSPVWYCGDTATFTYPENLCAHLDLPTFAVPEQGFLVLRYWLACERWETEPDQTWDGATLSISSNGGDTWETLTPLGGYAYQIAKNPESPLPAGTPCLAGDGSEGWQVLRIPLAAYAGQTVRIRFTFSSDANTSDEGWYVAEPRLYADAGLPAFLQADTSTVGTLAAGETATIAYRISAERLDPVQPESLILGIFSNGAAEFQPIVPITLQPVTATRAVPLNWLIGQGFTGDYEVAAESDPDGDGSPTWKEYWAGTDPNDPVSALRFIAFTNGVLSWTGGETRTQYLQRATSPTGAWQNILVRRPPVAITNSYKPRNPTNAFFRIRIPTQ